MSRVLDASVFIAAISPNERHHSRARRLYDDVPEDGFDIVPALFRVEVVSALTRRGEPLAVVETADALLRGPRFLSVPIDDELLDEATRVARTTGLRAYDAVYAALALREGADLCTLDADLATRLAAACPALTVVSDPGR